MSFSKVWCYFKSSRIAFHRIVKPNEMAHNRGDYTRQLTDRGRGMHFQDLCKLLHILGQGQLPDSNGPEIGRVGPVLAILSQGLYAQVQSMA